MAWVGSILIVPLGLVVYGVSGLGSLWNGWLEIAKNSDLPPFENIPFLVFPIVGLWLAVILHRRHSNPIACGVSLSLNGAFLLFVIYSFFVDAGRC